MTALEWNRLVSKYPPSFGTFLQAYEWGEFQLALGFKTERIFIEDKSKVMLAQATEFKLPLGVSYWHVPKGPLGDMPLKGMLTILRQRLSGGAFIKLEPSAKLKSAYKSQDRQPATTSLIDLTQSTEVLLGNFKQKTRYNTRLAEKKGVTCEIVSLDRFEDLVRLMQQTAERDHFHLHSLDHYKIMLETLNTDQCRAFLAMAFYEGRPLAANVMIDAFGTRTYLHGASSNLYRNVMAPYALHKFLILDAQSQGLATYDFWGIAPPGSDDNHPWAGITRFKAGFGGRTVTMPGTFDVAKQPLVYWAYRLAKGLRR